MKAHRWAWRKSETLWEDAWMENGESVLWECEGCGAKCSTVTMDEQRGVRCKSPGPPGEEDLLKASIPQDCEESTVREVHLL